MSSFKVEQRRLLFRGREFHFVSYEGRPANERKGDPAEPPMWYLMAEGKRRAVMPHTAGDDPALVDRALLRWLEEHIFPKPESPPPSTAPVAPAKRRRG
ncbi:MAG TPA: hypothetical protein VFS11_04495 [Gemmatimonadales bacterium]|nr:hypothetical protein [Gemmatimonadales bacterium]